MNSFKPNIASRLSFRWSASLPGRLTRVLLLAATLAAARQCGPGKIHVIFQPHRYTRTQDLLDEFATAFEHADSLFVLDIYAASEPPIEGVSGEILVQHIAEQGNPSARYVGSFGEAVDAAAAVAHPGDLILTLGAGSVSQIAPLLLEELRSKIVSSSAATSKA